MRDSVSHLPVLLLRNQGFTDWGSRARGSRLPILVRQSHTRFHRGLVCKVSDDKEEKVEEILGSLFLKGPPHLAPGGANLPVATEVQLTRLGDVGPGEMSTTLWRYGGATTSKFLSAEQLAVLGARPTGSAAGCPLASLPAVGEGEGERWVETCGGDRLGPA